ncbi:hypothetical protein GH714_034292 [Hevea brasiliensis]|uniref:K-box domain-containing protein n=1 Tax=Hevea brasiliensis TaxID=3981 RepID=A0A6A6M638_HEVBR|nr:hypothetical protein GH714_034292 [Hevea brasiliensis]
MENTLTRYCKGLDLKWLELSPDEHEIEKRKAESAKLNALKDEVSQLRLTCLQMMGQQRLMQFDRRSFKELHHLERQLSEGLHSVEDKKEQKFIEENEKLRKQVEELQRSSSLSKSTFLEFNPFERRFFIVRTAKTASNDGGEKEEESDNDFQLSCDGNKKRKASKSESMCNNSESQVGSERFTVRRNHFYAIVVCRKTRIRLLSVGQPHRNPVVPPPTPKEVADHELHKSGDEHAAPPVPPIAPTIPFLLSIDRSAFVAQVVIADITTKPIDPWEVVDRDRRLEAYEFEGSSNADTAYKWLKRMIKVFDLMKFSDTDRMDNVHGLL